MQKNKPILQYALLAVLMVWAWVAQSTISGLVMSVESAASQYPSAPFEIERYTARISHVSAGYENSGLRAGDDILSIAGEPVRGDSQLDTIQFNLRPGQTVPITVRRVTNGRPQILTVPVQLKAIPPQALDWVTILGLYVLFPLFCLTLGFFIAFARPRDPVAWITMAMLVSFSQLISPGGFWAIWPPWRQIAIAYHSVLSTTWSLWILGFALYFPVPFAVLRKRPWIKWLLPLPLLALLLLTLYGEFMEGNHIDKLGWLAEFTRRSGPWVISLVSLYIGGFFASLGAKRSTLADSDAKRRLDVMRWGSSLALGPLLLLVLSELRILPQFPVWLVTICLLMLLLFPITMAYVIVVQRAMDVRMVVRTGVKYALASTGIKILRVLLTIDIFGLTLHFTLQTNHRGIAVLIAASGAALIFGLGRLARKVSNWMDRRFFREAYNTEVILSDLSNSVATIHDLLTLLETVTHCVSDSLHVPRVAVLLDRDGHFEPAYALGFNGSIPPVDLNQNAATIRLLKDARSPSKVYFDDPQSWVHGAPEDEQATLRALDTQILLPLSLNSRMLGVISLGPKRSEAPYSRGDLQLLGAVASQTGLALENARLTENIKQEVAQRERINRELEIAREVQQRLFPQNLPKVEGLDFAGYCRPAFGVGGDYYDFIKLSDGCLGLAVGDVSGKGIAAALLMASLQASLRGQTIQPSETLSEVIAHINQLVCEASAENRYATFFYAQYEPWSRQLRYVNAGHNPPIVCRKNTNGPAILRLADGGTVVGLFPQAAYQESRLALEAGDVMVAFTDGISEAMNNAEEEWEEERLIEAVQRCDSRSAADMITCILERVDTFTAGARQHDDMTLIVLRVQ